MLCVIKAERHYSFLIEALCYSPEIRRQADIRDRAGGIAKAGFRCYGWDDRQRDQDYNIFSL
jgi:hypothetical protein